MATVTLSTTGPGDETNIETLVGAATHWQAVLTDDGDTSYVQKEPAPGSKRDLYTVTVPSDLGIAITSVEVFCSAKLVAPINGNVLRVSLNTNGTIYNYPADADPAFLLSNSYNQFSNSWTTNPQTGLAWTLAEVQAMQAGIKIHGYGATYVTRVTYLWVVVTYTEAVAPTLTTEAVADILATKATGNGTITDTGGAAVTEHGVCWNTTGTPTTSDSKTTDGAAGVGAFTSSMTGLAPGATYYVRAYATNSKGTSYGAEVTFTTLTAASGGLAARLIAMRGI